MSMLVPGPVATSIGASLRHHPGTCDTGLREYAPSPADGQAAAGPVKLDPERVGELVVAGIRAGDRYIITHPEMWPRVEARQRAIRDAFASAAEREQSSGLRC